MPKENILKLWNQVSELQPHLKKAGEFREVLQEIDREKLNPDEHQLYNAIYRIERDLFRVYNDLALLNKEVKYIGRLKKRSDGRYGLDNEDYFTSGSTIEVMVEGEEYNYWMTSRVEHNHKDYYIVDAPELDMEGLYVRIRKDL